MNDNISTTISLSSQSICLMPNERGCVFKMGEVAGVENVVAVVVGLGVGAAVEEGGVEMIVRVVDVVWSGSGTAEVVVDVAVGVREVVGLNDVVGDVVLVLELVGVAILGVEILVPEGAIVAETPGPGSGVVVGAAMLLLAPVADLSQLTLFE